MVKRYTSFVNNQWRLYGIGGCYNDMDCKGDYTKSKGVDKFAEFENAEAAGLLWVFPCKPDDTLYIIDDLCKIYLGVRKVDTIEIRSACVLINTNHGDILTLDEIGKTAFFTEAEARKKLKELHR